MGAYYETALQEDFEIILIFFLAQALLLSIHSFLSHSLSSHIYIYLRQ